MPFYKRIFTTKFTKYTKISLESFRAFRVFSGKALFWQIAKPCHHERSEVISDFTNIKARFVDPFVVTALLSSATKNSTVKMLWS
jgi:hypothetical protein